MSSYLSNNEDGFESNEVHELELAKIQSLNSAKQVMSRAKDFVPVVIFALIFLVLGALWWLSFR